MKRNRTLSILASVALIAGAVTTLPARTAADTYTATATVKGPKGPVTAPVVIVIERYTTDEERSKAAEALKTGGTTGLKQALEKMPAIGQIVVRDRQNSIKYAYARSIASGQLVTVFSDRAIAYLGEMLPNAKPKAGFDLAFALLNLSGSGKGSGELGPAAKVKIDAGTIVTEDYGAEVVRLVDIEKK